jgi:hypothetical protein
MESWRDFQEARLANGRDMDPFNPVVLNEAVSDDLANLYRHPVLLDVMEAIYPDLGFYTQRFVLKDRHNRQPVFLHQDFSYNSVGRRRPRCSCHSLQCRLKTAASGFTLARTAWATWVTPVNWMPPCLVRIGLVCRPPVDRATSSSCTTHVA